MHQMSEQARIGSLLDLIYESALDAERWPSLLERLAGLFRCHFADVFARTSDRTRYRGAAFGLDERDYQDVFLDTWVKRNIWANNRPVETAGEVLSTRQMVSPHDLMNSEMYADYLAPRGLHEGLRLAIWAGGGWVQDISLLRPWSAGAFEPSEIALGEMLLPHLQRAATVARRLRAAEARERTGLDALETLRHPMILLGADGQAVHFNASAALLVAEGDGLGLEGALLRGANAAATAALRSAVASGVSGRRLAGTVRLPRASGRPPLTMIVMPLGVDQDWSLPAAPAALAVVSDPLAVSGLTAPRLAELFGLTQAEAELAVDLLSGFDVTEVADRRGRSVHTVRSHLARLMGKTQTRRQSELMRLLMDLPPVRIDAAEPAF